MRQFSSLEQDGERASVTIKPVDMPSQVLQQGNELRDTLPVTASIALTALSGVYFERNQFAQADYLLKRAADVDPDPVSVDEIFNIAILRAPNIMFRDNPSCKTQRRFPTLSLTRWCATSAKYQNYPVKQTVRW